MADPLSTAVPPLAAAAALALLWAVESLAPFFHHHEGRLAHAARNTALGLINGTLRALVFPASLLLVSAAAADAGFGLLHWLRAPTLLELALAILLLDAWNYAWHIASHKLPFLWRFHTVHHHDESPDATTAFRFHTGDILLSSLATLAAVAALGLSIQHVLVYELILLPASLFHHANIRLPERADRILRLAIVTPRMHWVHHSRWQPETDSNYSSIFSIWDRLFGTLRLRRDPATLALGLDGYSPADTRTLRGCLATPLGPIKSGPGAAPTEEHLPEHEGRGAAGRRPAAPPSRILVCPPARSAPRS